MISLKKSLCVSVLSGLLGISFFSNVKAADGDIYNLNSKTLMYTRSEYLADITIYDNIVNLTTLNPEIYGLEKDSKVFSISNINDNIGNKIEAGESLASAVSNAYDGITEQGQSTDYSQTEEDFDVETIE